MSIREHNQSIITEYHSISWLRIPDKSCNIVSFSARMGCRRSAGAFGIFRCPASLPSRCFKDKDCEISHLLCEFSRYPAYTCRKHWKRSHPLLYNSSISRVVNYVNYIVSDFKESSKARAVTWAKSWEARETWCDARRIKRCGFRRNESGEPYFAVCCICKTLWVNCARR